MIESQTYQFWPARDGGDVCWGFGGKVPVFWKRDIGKETIFCPWKFFGRNLMPGHEDRKSTRAEGGRAEGKDGHSPWHSTAKLANLWAPCLRMFCYIRYFYLFLSLFKLEYYFAARSSQWIHRLPHFLWAVRPSLVIVLSARAVELADPTQGRLSSGMLTPLGRAGHTAAQSRPRAQQHPTDCQSCFSLFSAFRSLPS